MTTRPRACWPTSNPARSTPALLWGPIAGYFAKQHGKRHPRRAAAEGEVGAAHGLSHHLGRARPGEDDWKRQLNDLIAKHQAEIDAMLLEFGVPLISEKDQLITQP